MKISVVQMNSGNDIEKNLATTASLMERCASEDNAELVALPEFFSFLSGNPTEMAEAGKALLKLDMSKFLSGLAKRCNVAVHAGSSLIEEDGKLFNQSFAFDRQGRLLETYRKLHLFDIVLDNGAKMFESDFISRGDELKSYDYNSFNFGCSICFDVRYPELYARLVDKGADVLFCPAAFTYATGAEHWEVLLRARAIETQCYVVAPAQIFSFSAGKHTSWGHSMIIDPWGTIIAQASEEEGFTTATISRKIIDKVRARIPVQFNRYWRTYEA